MVSQSFAPPVDSSLLFLFTHSHGHCWQASASFKTVVSQGVVLVLKSEPLLPCAMGHAQPHKNAATLPSPAFLAGKREGKLPQPQGNSELKSFLSGKEALIWVTKIKWWKKKQILPLRASQCSWALLGSWGRGTQTEKSVFNGKWTLPYTQDTKESNDQLSHSRTVTNSHMIYRTMQVNEQTFHEHGRFLLSYQHWSHAHHFERRVYYRAAQALEDKIISG